MYTMDINCLGIKFIDFAVGTNEFNKLENKDSKWNDPNGDKLILGVIKRFMPLSINSFKCLFVKTLFFS
tara:strand:- start:1107 stop:1313 length:207 start_codon:yes stop_codon:yes gene_type:complete